MYEQIHESNINRHPASDARVAVNHDVINEYAELIESGYEFPALSVYKVGNDYHLVDGLHRLMAYIKANKPVVTCNVFNGQLREAVLRSFEANAAHGLPRNNADKRNNVQVMLDDPEWSKLSNREIAKKCKVTHTFVNSMRKVETVSTPKENRAVKSPEIKKLSKLEKATYELREREDAINDLAQELIEKDGLLSKQEAELVILKASTPDAAQKKNLELAQELEELYVRYNNLVQLQKNTANQLSDSFTQIRKNKARIHILEKENRELTQKYHQLESEMASFKSQQGARDDEPLPY
ncbi:hypothetical protein [Flavobacterium sp.]|jgi:hypothetical protein|uniref:hypothetical protein n=1 Tax=Flavobacterium sp. TaxID=239 RepID=UPI0037C1651A